MLSYRSALINVLGVSLIGNPVKIGDGPAAVTLPFSRFIWEETIKKCSFLFKFKEGENFNHSNTLKVFRGLKLSPDAEIGQKGRFCKGLGKRNPFGHGMPLFVYEWEGR